MSFIQNITTKITSRETDPINKARVLMAFYLVLAYLFFGLFLVAAYSYTNQIPQLIRATFISIVSFGFLLLLYYFDSWRIVAHFILIVISLVGVWANLLFYVKGVNIATLQYIWLASALGFYMCGYKWGWFYTLINVVPVLIDTAFSTNGYFFFTGGPQIVARPIYVFVLAFGFGSIAFLHYFFFVVFNRNITSLTETKNQLNEINEQLNKKVLEINQLSNARMSFVSTMSHELRTPLNGVIGLTNVLLVQNPREDQEETLAVLKFSAENLLALVSDVLDFNKLDSEMVQLERIPFSLSDFISNIYASTKIRAEEKHLSFSVEIDDSLKNLTLIGDPTRLAQVLLNLINNSIKFTEKGSVKLVCKNLHLSANQAHIKFSVQDTGIGIDKKHQQSIFEEFVQASTSTNREFGGTGLGLPIVKKVLALHESVMHIESELGVGSDLNFDIVFAHEKASSSNIAENPAGDLKAMDLSALKVLVVEDNAINIMVMTKTLTRIGINPAIAENGAIAVDMVLATNYDLILMDLYMPVLDGYDAAKRIRALDDAKKSRIPIVAITATVNSKVLEEVIEVGMNGYLSKPFHPDDLFKELKKHLV